MAEQSSPSASAAQAVEPSRGLSVYKPGQGYYTRMGTVVGVALVSLLGLLWLWEYFKLIPIGSTNPLYVAATGAILVGGAITAITYYLVFVKPGSVDFLIATEGEMKKVNWSTRREVVGSATAVIFTAVVLALFCWGLEIFFVWFFQLIKVLES
ncbi:MAG: preprotein translocase subunit SecE [bacterium]|jgi:preprotein translocase SecE subunit